MAEPPPRPLGDSRPALPRLSSKLMEQLWSCMASRLHRGEPLITTAQFEGAMTQDYQKLTGRPPCAHIQRRLRKVITAVNVRHPDTYVALGMQNGVRRAFDLGVVSLNWDEACIQAHGTRSIRRFTRRETIRDLLEEASVEVQQIDPLSCVEYSIQQSQRRALARGTVAKPLRRSNPGAAARPAPVPGEDSVDAAVPGHDGPGSAALEPEVEAAVQLGDVSRDEAAERVKRHQERGTVLRRKETEKISERLHVYVAQGTISAAEAEQVRELRQVDGRVDSGEISEREAAGLRERIIGVAGREAIEGKIEEAVDHTVRYLQVFEGMQKIGREHHAALEFLIDNKDVVVADSAPGDSLAVVMDALGDDEDLLDRVMDVVDRKDHEIRMISVRLPPYNYALNRTGLEKISNMTIEPDFLELLRSSSTEHISDQLHSEDPATRVRPAADMRCLVSLIDHTTKRTRFRKEVRMARLRRSIVQFYRDNDDLEAARHQAELFMKRSLRRLFPDLPREEAAEIREQGLQMIEEIEQQVLQTRRTAVEEGRAKRQTGASSPDSGNEGDIDITEEERVRGVLIGRVAVRVAGRYRPIPYRIMPDPDEPQRFVIAARDEETQELVPQVRRGVRRYVSRDRSGTWKLD